MSTKNNDKAVIIASLAAAAAATTAVAGVMGKGPAKQLNTTALETLKGNAPAYHPENLSPKQDSPLAGKALFFLGSSVTEGARSLHVSMADYLARVDGAIVTKDCVSGTTLTDTGKDSYLSRIRKHGAHEHYDAVIIQLSTNDAQQKLPLGTIAETKDSSFDAKTILGSLEEIIRYAQKMWHCPVFIYTSPHFNSDAYAEMVKAMGKITAKWGVTVIDLYNDNEINSITRNQRKLYMADPIHPTQAGYLLWLLPAFEKALARI